MSEAHSRHGEFCRVAENLYRHTSSGVYFARFRANGKEISHSLQRADRALAKRHLAEEMENASRIDRKTGKMTLELPLQSESVSDVPTAVESVCSTRASLWAWRSSQSRWRFSSDTRCGRRLTSRTGAPSLSSPFSSGPGTDSSTSNHYETNDTESMASGAAHRSRTDTHLVLDVPFRGVGSEDAFQRKGLDRLEGHVR